MAVNDAKSSAHDDPWSGKDPSDERRRSIHEFWSKIPEANQAWFEVIGLVPFQDILDIDELGDEYVQAPHIYAQFGPGRRGPFKDFIAEVETIARWDRRSFNPREITDGRIEYFPAEFREIDEDSN